MLGEAPSVFPHNIVSQALMGAYCGPIFCIKLLQQLEPVCYV